MAVRNRLLPYIESAGIIKTLTELLSETVLVVLNKIVAGPTAGYPAIINMATLKLM